MEWLTQPVPMWMAVVLFVMFGLLQIQSSLFLMRLGIYRERLDDLQHENKVRRDEIQTVRGNSNAHDIRINELEARGFWSWVNQVARLLARFSYERGGVGRYSR